MNSRRSRIRTRGPVSVYLHLLIGLFLVMLSQNGYAQVQPLDTLNLASNAARDQTYSLSLQTLIVLTSLAFLPTILLMMTSFARIVIVLAFLRQALGVPTAPSNQIIIGLALFLTYFVMSPTLQTIYTEAYQPFSQDRITLLTAIETGSEPLRAFMLRQTREADLALFLKLSKTEPLASPQDVPISVLIPSFMTSELKSAFQIGFAIFIPFLIIDIVVASILMSLGMMMVSPMTIALPLKLMIFVLVDGWQLLLGSLVQSFF